MRAGFLLPGGSQESNSGNGVEQLSLPIVPTQIRGFGKLLEKDNFVFCRFLVSIVRTSFAKHFSAQENYGST